MTLIQIIDRTDPRLGRHVRHDPRSKAFAFRAEPGTVLKDVEHPRHIPILDQGQVGSCTGNAAVGALGTGILWAALQPVLPSAAAELDEVLARGLYSEATKLDDEPGQWPPTDTGSDGLSIAKACKVGGFISGYQHAFSLADFLAALQRQPVIVGTLWYESMFRPAADGMLEVDPSSGIAGGHEYVARRYRAADRMIGFDNSWGAGWGEQGSFWIDAGTFGQLLERQGDATIFTPLAAPTPAPIPPNPIDEFLSSLIKDWEALIARIRAFFG